MAIFLYKPPDPFRVDSLSEEDLSLIMLFSQKQEILSGRIMSITPEGSPTTFSLKTMDNSSSIVDTIGEVVESRTGMPVSAAGSNREGAPARIETEVQTIHHAVNKETPVFALTEQRTDAEGKNIIAVIAIVRYIPSKDVRVRTS